MFNEEVIKLFLKVNHQVVSVGGCNESHNVANNNRYIRRLGRG
jgi:hypothetical protein